MREKFENEKGTLPVGIAYAGKVHNDYELRLERLRDVLDLEKEAEKDSGTFSALFLLSRELVRLGDIPKEALTPELLKDIASVDFNVLMEARSRLASSLAEFRVEGEKL